MSKEAELPSAELDLREHMKRTIQTAVYPFSGSGSVQALMYVGLGLAGESGEIANQIKKVARDNGGMVTPDRRAKIDDEIGDVFWYLLRLCYELGLDPYEVLERNRIKLAERAVNGTLNGDKRGARGRQAKMEWEADLAEAAGKEDVFAVPAEGYEKLITLDPVAGGLLLLCRSLRCRAWARQFRVGAEGPDAIRQVAMEHIMAEHTPWGRAGRE